MNKEEPLEGDDLGIIRDTEEVLKEIPINEGDPERIGCFVALVLLLAVVAVVVYAIFA